MCDSVPSARYSSVCNVLRQWSISLIRTYRVYRLYDILGNFHMVQIFALYTLMLISRKLELRNFLPVNFLIGVVNYNSG